MHDEAEFGVPSPEQRVVHRPLVRVAAAGAGSVVLLGGLALVLPLPEAGLPLIFLGLRLLGLQFRWARTANEQIDRWARQVRQWFDRRSRVARALIVWAAIAALVGLGWFVSDHYFDG